MVRDSSPEAVTFSKIVRATSISWLGKGQGMGEQEAAQYLNRLRESKGAWRVREETGEVSRDRGHVKDLGLYSVGSLHALPEECW